MTKVRPAVLMILFFSIISSTTFITMAADSNAAKELVGLWEAKRNFGPEIRGTLTVKRTSAGWLADIAGYSVIPTLDQARIQFKIPGDRGEFIGRFHASEILGHWIQPALTTNGSRYASPVVLKALSKNHWSGVVIPLEDEFTLFLKLTERPDGTIGAMLRNPDRNLGLFLNLNRIELNGNSIKLIGAFLNNKNETVLPEGTYHADEKRLSVYIPNRGGTFDFTKVDDDPNNPFYARGKNPAPYSYSVPIAENDGWLTGSIENAGMSIQPIKELIENVIEAPDDSVHSPRIHGLLIARHGKLVLEEYFHGFHRDQPHDSRSASKSLTSTLVGAAIQNGVPIQPSSSVYEIIDGNQLPQDLDPRKKKMTVEHLLTMSSGFDCDDSDPDSPGNEDVMQEQTQDPDWYHYTLNLKMIRDPGEKAVYCSINPNLLGNVLIAATGESLPELFQRLIATPLDIKRYYLNLMPTGPVYMGGGLEWIPRDFMKLGQLFLNHGMWNGRRVISKEWATRAISPHVQIGNKNYGYLWWLIDYPYKGRTVHAFYAGGNGGQVVLGIPELDLVIAFYAGNYSDRVTYKIQEEFVPKYILPAIKY